MSSCSILFLEVAFAVFFVSSWFFFSGVHFSFRLLYEYEFRVTRFIITFVLCLKY